MSDIRILLVDDQTIIRDGLRSLLCSESNLDVVGEAENGEQACRLAEELHPDLVLMDIRMPVMDGVAATRHIRQTLPDTVVLILTTFDDDDYIIEAMSHGAAGYLLKDISGKKLIEAIGDAVRGNIILPGQIAAKITSRLTARNNHATTAPPSNPISHAPVSTANEAGQSSAEPISIRDFSSREIDIIRLLIQGKSNREIAAALFLSLGTVKNYVSQIYLKIDTNDRAKALLLLSHLDLT